MNLMKLLARPGARRLAASLAAGAALGWAAPAALADIHVGVILSTTGPAASLGIPEKETISMWPDTMAGQKVRFTVLNDDTDTTAAARAARKLITEENVDVIIGPSVTPTSLAVVEVAGEAKVPMVSLAGGGSIVLPQTGPRVWAFKLSPTEPIAIDLVLDHFKQQGGKTMATIGFATSYGEGFLKQFEKIAKERGVKITTSERYNTKDQGVTAQVLKIMATNPDGVYIFASGTAGALPQIELAKRGYKGPIYQTQGVANNDYLRVGGAALEGSYMTVAPALVPEQLAPSNPIKKPALDYVQRYEAKHGAGSRSLFGATAWDAMLIVEGAAREALKAAKPGTPAFRSALRDAIEGLHEFVGAEGVYNMSPKDHNGVDKRSQVLVRIEDGKWKLQPDPR